MAEKAEESSPVNTKKEPLLCEECNKNPSKYKCPGCSLRTCSLLCVNSHKQRTSCTGKRCLSDVVPISKFDDNLLLSDYNMLEEVRRMAEAAKRTRFKVCGYSHFMLPFPMKSLQNAAASRRIKLLFLSNGMSRREKNKTCYNKRKKFISWTIEWRFHSTDVVLVDHGVHEDTTLSSLIENHLKPGPWNHSLRQFCNETPDSLKFFVRKYPKGVKSPFCQLNAKTPIREQLAEIVILEYPVIHVYLPSHSIDFEVINIPSKADIKKPPSHHNSPSPKSVTFREEEIKDEESTDPLVSDLMNYPNKEKEKQPIDLLSSPSLVKGVKRAKSNPTDTTSIIRTEVHNVGTYSCSEQSGDIAHMDFDFEPGLMDMYPDIIAGANSDGVLIKNEDLEGESYLLEEELEEGEIA